MGQGGKSYGLRGGFDYMIYQIIIFRLHTAIPELHVVTCFVLLTLAETN